MKNSKNRGITLVALVVTIIILLILSGIAIASLTGSGLFAKSEEAKQRTIIAQLKEEIEIAIQEIQIEEIENGNILTLQIISEKLPQKLTGLTARLEQIYIVGEYKGYDYTIDDKFKVEINNKIQGISINYTLSNTDLYTNQDIILSISAQSTNGGIVSLSGPDDIVQNQDGTYTITKNGNYEFIAVDSENNAKSKIITISSIDKILPNEFTPIITNVTNTGFTITASTQDGETTEEFAKSGIDKYEICIGDQMYETTQTTYEINGLKSGTEYVVYVNAYDKAGNVRKSQIITQETEAIRNYIYKRGNEYSDITGGWSITGSQGYSGTSKEDDYLKIWYSSASYNVGLLKTTNYIDITNYSSLHVLANYTGSHCSNYAGRFEILTPSGTKDAIKKFTYVDGTESEYELDISSFSGEYLIRVFGCARIYIYEIWFE